MKTTEQAWLGVVSRAHVLRGVSVQFAQLCRGKATPLRKMRRGDWLVYYSPSFEMGGEPLKAFTAIGRVPDDEVFEFDMGEGFVPHRRRIEYLRHAREVPLARVQSRLELCARPNWGIVLRRGHLPLAAADLVVIAEAMGVSIGARMAPAP
jgi:hypothetical protein